MKRLTGRLRVRLAVVGFVVIYLPLLALLNVVNLAEEEVVADVGAVGETTTTTSEFAVTSGIAWAPVLLATALFAPIAAALSWWLAGRVVRPIEEAIVIQEQLIEETSHELRTPLSVLSTNADVLLSHPDPTVDLYRTGLERSRSAAQRMSATIDSLLVDARGRTRTIDRTATDLTDLVERTVDGLRPLAATKQVDLRTGSAGPIHAAVDGLSVERAVTNLVTNAIEAAPRSSAVLVDVTGGDDRIEVAVTDEGPGIPADDQASVFERYWRTDAKDGSGLGLAIVRQVALAHGGEVSVRSPVRQQSGSRFCFTIAL